MSRERLITRMFLIVFSANLLQGIAFAMFLHLSGFLKTLGAGEGVIGLIAGFGSVFAIALRPVVGRLIDTVGRRPVVLTAAVVDLLAILAFLLISEVGPLLYIVRGIQMVSSGSLFAVLLVYGADVVPASRRTEGLALFGVSGLAPLALGGIAGDLALRDNNYDTLFIVAAMFVAASLVFSWFLPESVTQREAASRTSFRHVVSRRQLLPVWWLTFVFSFVLVGYFVFLKTFVEETGVGSVGLFFGAYAATAVVLRLSLAWLPARIGENRVLFPAVGFVAVGFLVLALSSGIAGVILSGMLGGIGHGFAFPILYSQAITRVSDADRGSSMALFTSLFDVGPLVAAPILGVLIEATSYQTMYATLAGLTLVGLALYWVGNRRLGVVNTLGPAAVAPSVP
ncbi:MAG: MFS transporter [Acidobacteria bacterium]|nr:MFS transporter [Acidobacteriota bacterium]